MKRQVKLLNLIHGYNEGNKRFAQLFPNGKMRRWKNKQRIKRKINIWKIAEHLGGNQHRLKSMV